MRGVRLARGSSPLRRVSVNVSLLAGTVAISRATVLLIFSIVAHRLGARALGIFGVTRAYAAYWFVLTDLGLSPRLVRDGAADPDSLRTDFAASLNLKLVALVVPSAVVVVAQLGWGDKPAIQLFSLLTAAMCTQSIAYLFESAGRAAELNKIEAISSSVQAGLVLVLAVTLLLMGGGLVAVGVASLTAGLTRLFVSILLARRWVGVRAGRAWQPSLLRRSAPYSVVSLTAGAFVGIDVPIIGLITNPAMVGDYIAVSRPLVTFGFLVKYAGVAAIPAAVRLFQRGRDRFQAFAQQATALAFLVGAALALLIFALAEPMLSVLYGSGFVGATNLLRVTALYLPLAVANAVLDLTLTAAGMQRDQSIGVLVGLAVTVVLCIALVPSYGSWGATTQFLVSELVLQVILLWRLRSMSPSGWRLLPTILPFAIVALGTLLCVVAASLGSVLIGALSAALVAALGLAHAVRQVRPWLSAVGPPAPVAPASD